MRYWRVIGVGYLALMGVWIYAVLDSDLTDSSAPHPFWGGDGPLYLAAALHLALGFAIGRWWAPALLAGAVLLAIPAGFEPDGYPEVPIAVYLGFQAIVFGVPLVLLGVLARKLAGPLRVAGPCRGWTTSSA